MKRLLLASAAAAAVVMTAGLLAGTGVAGAATASSVHVCSGSLRSPGVLAGQFDAVEVRGLCVVNQGAAVVTGNLRVSPNGTLVAAFGRNDRTHRGTSSLSVGGDIVVGPGAAAIIGCEPTAFPCIDDPNPKAPTLSSHEKVRGSVLARSALGVIVHNTAIGIDVNQNGGGGGFTCAPQGIFNAFQSPVYSDYEDNTVGRNFIVNGLTSCWLGALRNDVGGAFIATSNHMKDPDANELVSNRIHGDILCSGNAPAVQFGDSHGTSNVVSGAASGQCNFRVRQHDPEPNGPLTHISVRA